MVVKEQKGNAGYLYFSAYCANVAMLIVGIALAWTSPSLPKLNGLAYPDENPLPEPITSTQQSLIASLVAVGGVIGPFLAGISADRFGRKIALLLLTAPIFLSFAILAFARQVWLFYVARLLAGIGCGGVYLVVPNYIAEISEKHNRGSLSCLLSVSANIGNLLVYAVGPYMSIKYFCILVLVPQTAFFVVFAVFAPETPYYLMAKNNVEEARYELSKLRKNHAKVEEDIADIGAAVRQSFSEKFNFLDLFCNMDLLQRISIAFCLVTFQQFSGINVIRFYLQNIFDESETNFSPEISAIIIGIVQLLGSAIAPFLMDRLGRRFLIYISCTGTLISLLALGTFFYMKDLEYDNSAYTWVPLTSLIVYIIMYGFGIGPVPWTILGEIFAPNVKAAASTCTVSCCFFFTFCTTVFFPYMTELIGVGESFWFFGACCAVCIVYTYFFVPETTGKSLSEIQNMLRHK